ncbi:Rpn family recombination-promoting nuclease/putative transposase [Clostridium sediminicola]|uniref:Rpn family recombination-promoting nuclease/putative transposase n=1 Tax=Clostridium sediminicola TaxID=3114879 RepID=UPI003D186FE2
MKSNTKIKLDPKNDVVFQKIFGIQKNKDILISFLDAILEDENIDIQSIEFDEKILNNEMILDEKIGILDIRAKTTKGIQINIEIQLINQYNMIQRTLFYWSKLFFSQIKSGSKYSDLKKTITINLLNFDYLQYDNFHSNHHIYEDTNKLILSDILEIHFIEIPKFLRNKKDFNNPLHRWLIFLANPEDEVLEEIEMADPKIKKAHDILEYLSEDEETIRLAELRKKKIMDEISRLEGAKEEGLKEGREEGAVLARREDILENLSEIDTVAEDIINMVNKETDIEKLKIWLKYSIVAESLDDFIKKISK